MLYSSASAQRAFPEAEGFGAQTVAGRGGAVIAVTNLADSGPGSLRAALEHSGPRIVVFTTGGTITTQSTLTVREPFLTIAGQTAPGGGITIRSPGHAGLHIATHDVVVRYLTIRNGSGGETEAIAIHDVGGECENIVIDHCSLSWATDEVAETWYRSHDITFSWNIIAEGLDCSTHSESCHSKGLMFGSEGSEAFSIHHNLLAHNVERNPIIQIDNVQSGKADVINNVFYNSKNNPTLLWDRYGSPISVNFVGNYHKLGPDSRTDSPAVKSLRLYCDDGDCDYRIHARGNLGPARMSDAAEESDVLRVDPGVNADWAALDAIATSAIPITSSGAQQGYEAVLAVAGAGNSQGLSCTGMWGPRRDGIDQRIADEVRSGTAFAGTAGTIIDDESEVGGWVEIAEGTACADTDADGMPDAFEQAMGFDPALADAQEDANADGYTNIEEYINGTRGEAGPCLSQGGECCGAGQMCAGGTLQASSDCGGQCCVAGSCHESPVDCRSQGNTCCERCRPGNEVPAGDDGCDALLCCQACDSGDPLPDTGATPGRGDDEPGSGEGTDNGAMDNGAMDNGAMHDGAMDNGAMGNRLEVSDGEETGDHRQGDCNCTVLNGTPNRSSRRGLLLAIAFAIACLRLRRQAARIH